MDQANRVNAAYLIAAYLVFFKIFYHLINF